MAHIRQKFKGAHLSCNLPRSGRAHMVLAGGVDGNLNGYEKKKYLSKIVFTYILGYPVDVGHMEAVNLISSPVFSEKQIVRPLFLPVASLPILILSARGTSPSRCSWTRTRTWSDWSSTRSVKTWTTSPRCPIAWPSTRSPTSAGGRWPSRLLKTFIGC